MVPHSVLRFPRGSQQTDPSGLPAGTALSQDEESVGILFSRMCALFSTTL